MQQKKVESHLIGESLFNYQFLNVLRKEDFMFYRREFEIIKACKGDQVKILTEYPDLYKVQDSIVYVALDTQRLILFLTENTFKHTLQVLLKDLNGNAKEMSESVLYDDIINSCKNQDIFDLMDSLPDYFEGIGLPTGKLNKWVTYCRARVDNIREEFKLK